MIAKDKTTKKILFNNSTLNPATLAPVGSKKTNKNDENLKQNQKSKENQSKSNEN